jgi:hypothetical protein
MQENTDNDNQKERHKFQGDSSLTTVTENINQSAVPAYTKHRALTSLQQEAIVAQQKHSKVQYYSTLYTTIYRSQITLTRAIKDNTSGTSSI